MIVGCGNLYFVIDLRFDIGCLSGERILDGLYLVDIPIVFLLLSTNISIMFLEFLGWCESGQQWVVGCHSNTNFIDIKYNLKFLD